MPCDACPTPDRCHAATGHLPGLCEWAAMGGHWRERVARRNALPPPGEAPPPPDRPAPPEPDPSRPSVRTYHAATRTLLACPYRDHRCGCSLPTCHAHRGDRDDGDRATRDHCLACLKQTWSIT